MTPDGHGYLTISACTMYVKNAFQLNAMILFRTCPTCNHFIIQRCNISSTNRAYNHYLVLGLKKDATEKEIKRSYLEKCKEYHPDKHFGDKSMQKKFVEVNEAYQVLSDSAKRSEYDARLFGGGSGRSGYQNPYRTWRPDSNEYQKGPRSGPRDYWKQANQRSSGWDDRDFGGGGAQHPYEEFFRQRKQQANSQSNRNSYHHPYGQNQRKRDPLNNFWDYHYKQRNQGNGNSYGFGSQNRQTYSNPNEQKIIIVSFLALLIAIIWIRIAVSFRNYKTQQQNEYDYFPEMVAPSRSTSPNEVISNTVANKEQSVDAIIQKLNVKTDEA